VKQTPIVTPKSDGLDELADKRDARRATVRR
jgi:hypothetical protein